MHPVIWRITDTIAIKSYGVALAVAFILGILITARNARKVGLKFSDFIDMGFWVVIAAIVGARVFFILFNLPAYIQDPLAVLKIWRGGVIFYGGLFAAAVTAIVFMKRRGIPVWLGADLVAPQVALGYAITRVGCFLNGCCYGKLTSLPWGVGPPGLGIRFHPVQLYASAANLVIFVILVVAWRHRRFDGQIFWGYLVLYSIYRFAIEFFRGDHGPLALGLTVPQFMSIVLFGCALAAWLDLRARGVIHGAGAAPGTI
ncbi:MAG: prolipoprotein diacylglyceryl transferase [candidate division Zixibacteria bacterium]|nr:prolipoprotein diacylglyceryl transferase [candidate division Zixibacteria bacterium]